MPSPAKKEWREGNEESALPRMLKSDVENGLGRLIKYFNPVVIPKPKMPEIISK